MCLHDELYVVFTKAKGYRWLQRLLHPTISHCYVVWPDCNRILVLDQSVSKTSIFTLDSINDIIGTKIKATVNNKGSLIGLNTCVSAVKRQLGISNPFILTPYQLYKYLRKRNEKA